MYYFDHNIFDLISNVSEKKVSDDAINWVNEVLTARTESLISNIKKSGHHGTFHARNLQRNGFTLTNPNKTITISVIADFGYLTDWEELYKEQDIPDDCFEVFILGSGNDAYGLRDAHRCVSIDVIEMLFNYLDATDSPNALDDRLFKLEEVYYRDLHFDI